MTSYPVLVEVQSEMARMKIIYDLYSAFEKFREDMSLTAWGELDVEVLKEGAISASRRVVVVSLCRCDSYLTHDAVGGRFSDFRATAMLRAGGPSSSSTSVRCRSMPFLWRTWRGGWRPPLRYC